MVNGRFVCYGDKSYLKKQYGEGYSITLKHTEQFDGNDTLLIGESIVKTEKTKLKTGLSTEDGKEIF